MHCLGTLRANWKQNPTEIRKKELKKSDTFAQQNERIICVLKWGDKRDVLFLSTRPIDEMVEIQRRGDSKVSRHRTL